MNATNVGPEGAQVNSGLSEAQLKQLTAELPRGVTETRRVHGQELHYTTVHYIHTRLNQVFGFDGWSQKVLEVVIEDDGTDMACRAMVRLTVQMGGRAIVREDVGVQTNSGRTYGDRLDTAYKGAVSDAIKRAARSLGSQFAVMGPNPGRQSPLFWSADKRAHGAVEARRKEK